MRIHLYQVRSSQALRFATLALIGLFALTAVSAHAQQATKYSLDAGGQKLDIDTVAYGADGVSYPESGSATLRRRMQAGAFSLSELAQNRNQKLLLRFRDPEHNNMMQYEFDGVKYGRYQQSGEGPDAVETLQITYSAVALSVPGSRHGNRNGNGNRGGGQIHRNVAHSNPTRQVHRTVRNVTVYTTTVHRHVKTKRKK